MTFLDLTRKFSPFLCNFQNQNEMAHLKIIFIFIRFLEEIGQTIRLCLAYSPTSEKS